MAETVEREAQRASDTEPRIPKWRLDEEIGKRRALKAELDKAMTYLAELERYAAKLEKRLNVRSTK